MTRDQLIADLKLLLSIDEPPLLPVSPLGLCFLQGDATLQLLRERKSFALSRRYVEAIISELES